MSMDLKRLSMSWGSTSTPKSLQHFLNSGRSRLPLPLSSAILNCLLRPMMPLAPRDFRAFLNLSIRMPWNLGTGGLLSILNAGLYFAGPPFAGPAPGLLFYDGNATLPGCILSGIVSMTLSGSLCMAAEAFPLDALIFSP